MPVEGLWQTFVYLLPWFINLQPGKEHYTVGTNFRAGTDTVTYMQCIHTFPGKQNVTVGV